MSAGIMLMTKADTDKQATAQAAAGDTKQRILTGVIPFIPKGDTSVASITRANYGKTIADFEHQKSVLKSQGKQKSSEYKALNDQESEFKRKNGKLKPKKAKKMSGMAMPASGG